MARKQQLQEQALSLGIDVKGLTIAQLERAIKVNGKEKEVKKYPLKRPYMIGNVLQPKGYEITLQKKAYEFYKRKNII